MTQIGEGGALSRVTTGPYTLACGPGVAGGAGLLCTKEAMMATPGCHTLFSAAPTAPGREVLLITDLASQQKKKFGNRCGSRIG